MATLVGELERMKAILWIRASAPAATLVRAADPLDELRHLTPTQVAELLNVTDAYVHELCRSRRIPAVKSGKYWIIPLTGLRAWLGQVAGQLDGSGAAERSSSNETPSAATPRLGRPDRALRRIRERLRREPAVADLVCATTSTRRRRRPAGEVSGSPKHPSSSDAAARP
jgi:excisionase family DNA binding protein